MSESQKICINCDQNCNELRKSRCRKCYSYMKKYGTERPYNYVRVFTRKPIEERFWKKVNKDGPIPKNRPELGPCWIWMAAKDNNGYGKIARGGRSCKGNDAIKSHILSYNIKFGDIPRGLELDHLCRNPSCVNPDHLEAVTHRENMLRGEGASGKNARKTHCIRGHEFTKENIYIYNGKYFQRQCKKCKEIRKKKSAISATS